MQLINEINDVIREAKGLQIDIDESVRMDLLKEDFSTAVSRVLDSAAGYIIKSMPVPDAVKDILKDVKDSLKTKDLKNVLSTAVKSSVREGLEIIGFSSTCINDLMDLKVVASKGGLVTAVKNGVEIVANNFLKNNIVGDYVYDFFSKLKSFIMNKGFIDKLETALKNIEKKKESFLKKCEEWYKSYENMDFSKMNSLSEELSENTDVLRRYIGCRRENSIIQNMTAMVNNKKDILTANQERLCEVI